MSLSMRLSVLIRRSPAGPPSTDGGFADAMREFEAARKKVEALGWEVRLWRRWDGRRTNR